MSNNFLPVRGTKDFLPKEAQIREKIRTIILKTYEKYGFNQIKTPIIEDINLLLGSEGGENLKLIYKILKRGEKLNLNASNENELVDLGLRYDLTVPLARFYASNVNELLPVFKAIQIDDVFRAERPQKGRSRQFTQCDIDIINEETINGEIEVLFVAAQTLLNLGCKDFTFKISDRRILNELLLSLNFKNEDLNEVCIVIDKLDKIGLDGIKEELLKKDYHFETVNELVKLFSTIKEKGFDYLKKININQDNVLKLEKIMSTLNKLADKKYRVEFDINIIRGQGYYTSSVFEVYLEGFSGACGGGGRYDNMIKELTNMEVPAVGFSFGFERLLLVIDEKELLKDEQEKLVLIYEDEEFSVVLEKSEQLIKDYKVTTAKKRKNFKFQLENLKANGYSKYLLLKENKITDLM